MVHEIVTLQLGELSNYLATHFWNTQESYFSYGDEERSPVDHNVHWRQGIGAGGAETFLPRTLIYDFRSGFGPLGKTSPLYEEEEEDDDDKAPHLWHGEATVHKQPRIPKSTYHAALDVGLPPSLTSSAVRYWSDFSRVYYHPRSIAQLSDLEASPTVTTTTSGPPPAKPNPQPPTLDTFEQGMELFRNLNSAAGGEDVLDDQLRPFIEECDLLQGMQVVVSGDDGWAGFGAGMLERIRDEYGKSCIWVWMADGLSGGTKEKRLLRLQNKAKALAETAPQATTLIPFSLPPRHPSFSLLDRSSAWHTSALLSTALESATLPTRLLSSASGTSLSDMSSALNLQGRHNIASLRMGVGEGRGAVGGKSPVSGEEVLDIDFFDLTGQSSQRKKSFGSGGTFARVLAQRGVGRSAEQEDAVYKSLFSEPPNPPTARYRTPLSYPLPDSFPHIYTDLHNPSQAVRTLSVDTLLSADSSVSVSAKHLRRLVLPSLRGDERETIGNALAEIQEEYHEGWSSGSEDDDD